MFATIRKCLNAPTSSIKLFKQNTNNSIYIMSNNYSAQPIIKEEKIVVKGQTINYIKKGNGNKKLLLFPGALGTIWSDFKPQVLNLDPNQFTVVAWDPPGYGFSRPPDRKFSLDFFQNDANIANDFMQCLGFKKYSLLGWSDGGISSLILSAKFPQVVDKLVVWGANSYILPEELESYENIRDISKWSQKMKEPLIKLYTLDGLQKMWNEWCDTMQQLSSKNGGDICKSALAQIQCPTLILHGDKDPMVSGEHPTYLKAHIKNSTLYRFADGKHNIHLKYADEFNKTVTDFLLHS